MPSATSATRGRSPSRRGELGLLAAEERRRGRVGDGRRRRPRRPRRRRRPSRRRSPRAAASSTARRRRQRALVAAARAAVEAGVAKPSRLHQREQLAVGQVEVDRGKPRAQQGAGVVGAEVGADRPGARVALGHHALGHPQDARGVRAARRAAAAEGAHGDRHRGVRPLGRRALVAARLARPARRWARNSCGVAARASRSRCGRCRRRRGRRSRRCRCRRASRCRSSREVELGRAGAVADLPDAEQLGEAAPVAGGQRRGDLVEGVRERAGDPVSAGTRATASTSRACACSHSWSSGVMPRQSTCTACGSPAKPR